MPGAAQQACCCWSLLALVALIWAAQPSAAQQACPGVAAGVCGRACQQATCQALQAFFDATHINDTWHVEDGWQLLRLQTCQELVAGGTGAAAPSYCSWHGLVCCTPAAVAAGECSAANSISSVSLPVNALNGSIANATFLDAVGQLHACGLSSLVLEGNDLSGSLSPRWGTFTQLRTLDLGINWLTGTLPDTLAALTALQRLEVNANFMYGSLPPWLNNLTQLEVLNLGGSWAFNGTDDSELRFTGNLPLGLLRAPQLRELNLDGAALAGSIPNPLCGPATSLQVLSMRNSGLTGSAAGVLSCSQMSQLDLSHNQLTGPLPATASWGELELLHLQDNAFTGSIPEELYAIPFLASIDISDNRLTGPLSRNFLQMQYMNTFLASNNRLSGTIPGDLFYAPSLTRLDLDNNALSGTLPATITYAASLEELILSDNPALTGPIPDGMAALAFLTTADLTNTSLACSSLSPGKPCAQPLPCFLQFANYQVPVGTDQRCSAIVPKSPQQAASSCPPELAQQLLTAAASTSGQVPAAGVSAASAQGLGSQWKLDSSYYQQRTCQCGADSIELWNPGRTALRCQPRPVPNMPWWAVLLISLLGTVGVLFVVGLLTRVMVGLRYQPGWLRQQEMRHKRVTGPPKSGMISVVVTDIEGYNDLMRASPSLMARALALHNAVLKRASWTNGGHRVTDAGHRLDHHHESESFTIAFHEPADAVCFCLQAQQALMRVDWPANLGVPSEGGSGGSGAESTGASGWRLLGLHLSQSSFGKSFAARARRHNSGMTADGRQRVSSEAAATAAAAAAAQAQAAQAAQAGHVAERQHSWGHWVSHSQPSNIWAGETRPSGGSSLFGFLPGRRGRSFDHQTSGGLAAASTGTDGRNTARSTSSAGSGRRFFPMLLRPVTAQSEGLLFYGLRVRMGIATGMLEEGTELQGSAVADLAKLVCDAGAGGQVLMEAHTFEAVKDRLNELGAVDARGLNDRLLQAKRIGRLRAALAWRFRGKQHAQKRGGLTTGGEAVVMDMGEFEVPGISQEAAAAAAAMPAAGGIAGHGEGGLVSRLRSSLAGTLLRDEPEPPTAAEAAVSRTHSNDSQKQRGGARLRLYSVLPPALVGRAKTWLNALSLKEGSVQTDRAYFDAPGTLFADLDPAAASAADAKALPPISMVFCCVEGAKQYVRRRRAEARAVHGLISTCIKVALAASPGGYLCREQDGELKYMVAFPNAHEALEWCLVMQDAMLYQPWPASVLAHPGFEEVFSDDGHLLFRGPRLKMGLCEGHPRTIMPDHLGRADYHGPSINQAARFMDAAAHGGQIACELELAQREFMRWRHEEQHGTQPATTELQLPSIHSRDYASQASLKGAATSQRHDSSLPEQPPTPSRADATAAARAPSAPAAIGNGAAAHSETNPWVSGSTGAASHEQQQQQQQQQQSWASALAQPKQQQRGKSRDSFEEGSVPVQRDASGASTSSSAPTPPTPDLVAVVGSAGAPQRRLPSPFAPDSTAAIAATAAAPEAADAPHAEPRVLQTFAPRSSSGGLGSTPMGRRPTVQLPHLHESGEVAPVAHDAAGSSKVSSPTSPINPETQRRLALIFGREGSIKRRAPSVSRVRTQVEATHLGTFRFKGSGDVEMAAVSLAHLSGRQFPAEPPKGKGARVAERAGKADEASCQLPAVARPFRRRWEAGMRAEAALRLLTQADTASAAVASANNALRGGVAGAPGLASGSNVLGGGAGAAGTASGSNALRGSNAGAAGAVSGSNALRGNAAGLVPGSNALGANAALAGSNGLPKGVAADKEAYMAQRAAISTKRLNSRKRQESVPEDQVQEPQRQQQIEGEGDVEAARNYEKNLVRTLS